MKTWGQFVLWVILGVLYGVAGVFAIMNPLLAAGVLTLFLGAGLVAVRDRAHRPRLPDEGGRRPGSGSPCRASITAAARRHDPAALAALEPVGARRVPGHRPRSSPAWAGSSMGYLRDCSRLGLASPGLAPATEPFRSRASASLSHPQVGRRCADQRAVVPKLGDGNRALTVRAAAALQFAGGACAKGRPIACATACRRRTALMTKWVYTLRRRQGRRPGRHARTCSAARAPTSPR